MGSGQLSMYCIVLYFPQRFPQVVSQRLWPLRGMLYIGNDSCNLSRNGVARQVAREIAQCNSACAKPNVAIFNSSILIQFNIYLFNSVLIDSIQSLHSFNLIRIYSI